MIQNLDYISLALNGVPIWVISFLVVWSIFWSGLAMWHSARRGHVWWFVAFLLVHTLGILEIIYLSAVLKLKFSQIFSK